MLGDGVLTYESDFPHPECTFPDSTDHVLAWKPALGESATRKLMAENAMRFPRLVRTPWDDTVQTGAAAGAADA